MKEKFGIKANFDLIKRAINAFDWQLCSPTLMFMFYILNKTIINILRNFIPH